MPRTLNSHDASRRKFLAQCGRFAVITPPTITLMLAASRQSFAVAASGGTVGGVTGDGTAGAGALFASGLGGGGGGSSASFAQLGGGSGESSSSLGTAPIPPECAEIADPVEQAICVEEYAKGTGDERRPAGVPIESAGLRPL